MQISKQLGWPLEPSRSGFLPDSVKRWPPFKETNTQLDRFGKKFEIGLVSNVDDKLLGETRRHFKADFDLVVTAQQVRSYKPDPAHFKEAERRIGGKKGWVHVALQLLLRRRAVPEGEGPRDLGQPQPGDARGEPEEADRRGQEPARGGQAARRRLSAVQAVGLHPDVFVVTSRFWQTTCTLVKSGQRGVLHRLAGAPRRARAAAGDRRRRPGSRSSAASPRTPTGTTCSAATRSPTRRWGCAESSAARLRDDPGAAQRELREFDEENYVERPGPLYAAGQAQALPVPGHCALGDAELELHPADGHTVDGMALWIPWAAVLVVRRLPVAGRDPVDLRERSVVRLPGDAGAAASRSSSAPRTSCPATGRCSTRRGRWRCWARIVPTCRRWLERGADAALPLARRNGAMKKIHLENVARVTG